MAYSYKGSISFGLVYIPVQLVSAVKNNDVSFNMLDKKTMSRIKYKKTCVDCGGKEVKPEDIVKGYEYEPDKYIAFEDKDFEKLKSKRDKNITIESFVNLSEVDPVFFDKPYYVVPTGGEKAFNVLLKAMGDADKAGIAKTVLGTKETLILVRAKGKEMLLNTLFYADEIQKNPAKESDAQGSAAELKIAKNIIETMSAPFKPNEYKDEYRERLIKAIDDKIAGKEIKKPRAGTDGNAKITDLMEALQKSLEMSKPKKTVKKAALVKTEPRVRKKA
jgi:DNA end-binding protein Ku